VSGVRAAGRRLAFAADKRLITDPTFDPPGKRYFFGSGTASRKLHGPSIEFSKLA
jgi:hypothetical protein